MGGMNMSFLKSLFGLGKPAKTATQAPVASLKKEAANLYVLRIGGVINKATVDRIQQICVADFERGAKDLRVLMVLSDFKGWTRGDNWGDLSFFAQYEQNIARIAVVGDARWETQMLMFLGAGRRTGEVNYFAPAEEAKARAWLVAG
jgi:hypothetical protein